MNKLSVISTEFDFSPLHAAMQRYVDQEILSGVSSAVLIGQDLVDMHCAGLADRENNIPLRPDHIFRIYSNTKLITSLAILQLVEADQIDLDAPIETYIPELGKLQVLKPDATEITDTEPAKSAVTPRQLMTHTSGLTYSFLDPKRLISRAYSAANVGNPDTPLSHMIEVLAELPLVAHPGTAWEYSHATDVLARLVEVVSGKVFGTYLQEEIFSPLGMTDTMFFVPADKADRLAAYYIGADLLEPMKGGLAREDNAPFAAGSLTERLRQSGGGGLVSTLPDMLALLRALIDGGSDLFSPEIKALIRRSKLPDGMNIRFPGIGEMFGRGHGLASAICETPFPFESPLAAGEVHWGGVAGTQWWISPNTNSAGVLMTQRQMAFSHPFAVELKGLIYKAVSGE
jgi:CubicO group peptidase (beta-lactamase class C family)